MEYFKNLFFRPISLILKNAMNLNFYYEVYFSSNFSLKLSPMWMNKKRNDDKSITTSQKISEIFWVSLCPPSSPDLNFLDFEIWNVLENKTNATSHPNIGSLKTAIEEEWNKMSEQYILKACKTFQTCLKTTIDKMVDILSEFNVLCISSYFVVYSLKFYFCFIMDGWLVGWLDFCRLFNAKYIFM